MITEIEAATKVFECLEDTYHFDYHLKSEKHLNKSIISYYKDNFTVKITINHSKNYFQLNVIIEKDNSFTITSQLNKNIYLSENNSTKEFQSAKQTLFDLGYLKKLVN